MGSRVTLLIALMGLGAAAYVWTQPFEETPVPSVGIGQNTARERPHPIATEAPTRASRATKEQASTPTERAVAERRPTSGKWATVTIADPEDFPAPRPATASMPGKRLSSPKPGDDVARAQLVRDIQYELRRVGCYDGEVHGWWSSNTKRAMKAFTDRVNATLPVDEADYILLSLVQSHKGVACGRGCPAGQVSASDGRCLPRAIVAQRKGGTHKSSSSVAEAAASPSSVQQPSDSREPLPGRMAIGAPIAGASERAEIASEEARRDAANGLAVPASAAGSLAGAPANPSLSEPEAQAAPRQARPEHQAGPRSQKRTPAQRAPVRQIFATITRNAP